MTIIAAVACMLASTALCPLFISSLWFTASAGAVIAVAGTGTLTRLRTLPVTACLAAGAAGLLWYLNLVFESAHSLLFVIPTPASVTRLRGLAGAGLYDVYHRYTAPVPNAPGLLLLAAGGVGITALLTDLIAVRLRSTALAGLPLLVLFTVPAVIRDSHNQLANGLVFCAGGAGYLAMLSVDGRARVDAKALAAGARTGLAAIILALYVPLLLTGLHLNKLFSSGAGTEPLPQLTAQLHESRPAVVFWYTTTASPALQRSDPQYFRQYVFDTLDPGDAGWRVTNYSAGAARVSSMPMPQGLTDMSAAQAVTTTVTTASDFPGSGVFPAFLPLPAPAIHVSTPGRWSTDHGLMVYSMTSPLAGLTYSAVSYVVDPNQAQLEAAPPLTGRAGLAPDLRLPPAYQTAALKQLAQDQTSGQATEFGKVDALANWLSAPPFQYSLSASPFGGAAGLLSFLTRTKTGYCVQYAYAMTVLTRLLGIPARFVTGYTAGTPGAGGEHVVRNTDAHAWTEVYFPSLGWIRFEPTPGGQGGTASRPDYMSAPTQNGPSAPSEPVAGVATGPGSPVASPHRYGIALQKPAQLSGQPGRPAGMPRGIVLAVLAAITAALLAPAALRITRRRWRWARANDDVARAHTAWREFRDDLADFGLGGRPSEPPRTLAARVSAGLPEPASAAVRRLALAEERASYAGHPSVPQHLRRDGVTARRGLAAAVRRGTRWRARAFPASLLTCTTAVVARILRRS
jgi:hypothetical protein